MDNPKIRIESDGDITIVYLGGKRVKTRNIEFSAKLTPKSDKAVMWKGDFLKTDEKGDAVIENDDIVTEEFCYKNDVYQAGDINA